ncbi:MAG: ABC transporter permease [Candidatus Obscuribacterales bacterium]
MKNLEILTENLLGSKLYALVWKETKELLRNPYLMFLILIPPVVQLLILGASLDPRVSHLCLLLVDQSSTRQSRDLIRSLEDTTVFDVARTAPGRDRLLEMMRTGRYDVGLIVPERFADDLNDGRTARVAVFLDGADAYSSGIAQNYVMRTISRFKPEGLGARVHVDKIEAIPKDLEIGQDRKLVSPSIDMLFNPDQKRSWYFVPGILGACLTLVGTLVASALVLKELENGTIQQLLMTPASTWQITASKVIPLLVFLLLDIAIALTAAHLIFGMPIRGSLLLLMVASTLYALTGIGTGILLGTFCSSQRQAQLGSFFVNIPMILLSGAVVPFDTMPAALVAVSSLNPLRYYTVVVRSLILKGSTFQMIALDLFLLAGFSLLILAAGSLRLRRSLVV